MGNRISISDLKDNPTEENFKKYIKSGADINAKTEYGDILLHLAVKYKLVDMTRILLDKDIDVNVENYNRYTPLHLAINYKVADIAKLLIDHHADINAIDEYGDTLLHLAIKYKVLDIARLLIDNGASIHNKNIYGHTPLHIAIYYRLLNIARLLIDKGAGIDDRNDDGVNSLHIAITNNLVDIARLLIDKNAAINIQYKHGNTPLHLAIIYSRVDIARLLIDKGADIHVKNTYGNTPLHIAISYKLTDVVQLLIEKGADIHAKNNKGLIPSMLKYEREEYRNLLDNLIKFVSKIIIRQKIDGKTRLRFRSIFLGSSGTGRFYRCANTIKDLYVKELQSMASRLGCNSVMTKRGYCKYIAKRLEAYSCVYRSNYCKSVIGVTVILQKDIDFLHEPIENIKELYILLDANGRYYGFSRSDYQYLERYKINPHSTNRLTEDQMSDMNSFFKKFDGIDCSIYDNLI